MKTADKIKIFLVDDDVIFVESLKHCLKHDNAAIKSFSSGEECLKSMDEDPEIVVLDYALSNSLNGVQVLNKIRASHPDTRIIMLSGQDSTNIINDTMKYGAYDYITKGETALFKIKEEIDQICDEIESVKEMERNNRKLVWINSAILLIVILFYILNRLL